LSLEGGLEPSWNPFCQVADTSNRRTAQARGWQTFTERTPSSKLVRRGVDSGDFAESGHPNPQASKHNFLLSMASHGDELIEASDVILPIRCAYEEEGHYVNMEGRVQRHRSAVTSVAPSHGVAERSDRRQSVGVEGLTHAFTKSLSKTLRSNRSQVKVRPWMSSPRSRSGGLKTQVVPVIHDYYTEGHRLARKSPRMAKCSQTLGSVENLIQ
jgi:NADH dehydrogenase/NADH:ubiquinone oxidoreductase subunit G